MLVPDDLPDARQQCPADRRLVYAKLAELKKTFPTDVDYEVPFEAITIIRVSMEEVVKTLLKALALVALVVFLFPAKLAVHASSRFLLSRCPFWGRFVFSFPWDSRSIP